jgi:hypothetical protein
MVGESSVMWTPGMPALPLSEPVAFGAQVLSALSGISTAGGVALATSVAVVAGSNLDGTDAAGGTQSAGPKVNGSVFAGPVVGQGLVAGLKVQAFDDKGNSLGTADVKADGSFALELSSPNYKGVLVLKVYDDPNDSLTPKYMDEATGKEKSFDTPLLAVVNYSGDATTAQTVNVTPLSHLAALVAGVGTSSNNTVTVPSNLDKNVVQTANIQVAQKFGLVVDDLTSAEVISRASTIGVTGCQSQKFPYIPSHRRVSCGSANRCPDRSVEHLPLVADRAQTIDIGQGVVGCQQPSHRHRAGNGDSSRGCVVDCGDGGAQCHRG